MVDIIESLNVGGYGHWGKVVFRKSIILPRLREDVSNVWGRIEICAYYCWKGIAGYAIACNLQSCRYT